jgi:hypothetical protein
VLLGVQFPRALERMSGLLAALMVDRNSPRTATNSVFMPMQPGQERSGRQAGKTFSLYTSAQRHRKAMGLGLVAIGAFVIIGRSLHDRFPGSRR